MPNESVEVHPNVGSGRVVFEKPKLSDPLYVQNLLSGIGFNIGESERIVRSWNAGKADDEKFEIYTQANLNKINELESQVPGITSSLFKEFNIRHFMRYPDVVLVDQYKNRNKKINYGIVIQGVKDHNGAFRHNDMLWRKITSPFNQRNEQIREALSARDDLTPEQREQEINREQWGVRVIEAEDLVELNRAIINLNKKYCPSNNLRTDVPTIPPDEHKISFAMIMAHGGNNGFTLGKGDWPSLTRSLMADQASLTVGYIKDGYLERKDKVFPGNRGLERANKIFDTDSEIVFISCSTGGEDGIAQVISKQMSTLTAAPIINPTLGWAGLRDFIDIHTNFVNGKPRFVVKYHTPAGVMKFEDEIKEDERKMAGKSKVDQYYDKGVVKDRLTLIEENLVEGTQNDSMRLIHARTLRVDDNIEDAIQEYRTLLTDSSDAEWLYLVANDLSNFKNDQAQELALEAFKKCIKQVLLVDNESILKGVVHDIRIFGHTDDVNTLMSQILEKTTDQATSLAIAEWFISDKQNDLAIKAAKKAFTFASEAGDFEICKESAGIFMQAGEKEQAFTSYERAAELACQHGDIKNTALIARNLRGRGQSDRATKIFSDAMAICHTSMDYMYVADRIQDDKNSLYQQSIQCAIELVDKDHALRLIDALDSMGETDYAKMAIKRALEILPDDDMLRRFAKEYEVN